VGDPPVSVVTHLGQYVSEGNGVPIGGWAPVTDHTCGAVRGRAEQSATASKRHCASPAVPGLLTHAGVRSDKIMYISPPKGTTLLSLPILGIRLVQVA
jgi:hypothetical protein